MKIRVDAKMEAITETILKDEEMKKTTMMECAQKVTLLDQETSRKEGVSILISSI
jgi:hypothetical protein